jgi:predicted exporter
MTRRWALALGAAVVAAAGLFTATHLKVGNDLDYFLPDSDGPGRFEADVIRALTRSPLSRRLVLSIQGETPAQAVEGARRLQPLLAGLSLELVPPEQLEGVARLLFEHRWQTVSPQPARELPALFSPEGLRAAARRLVDALASPAGNLVRAIAPQDPLLLSRIGMERLAALDQRGLRPEGGVMTSPEGDRAFIFATTRAAAFDGEGQRRLWQGIDAAFARVNAAMGGRLHLESSGLGRYTVAAETSIRADTTRISVVSGVATIFMLWLVFGRLRVIPGILLPLAVGFLAGTTACLVVFGRIHGMTFAFGSSLMGVCVDYPLPLSHYRELVRNIEPARRRAVVRALFLGWLTTVVGVAAMGGTSIPGLREIAVFGCAGVTTAFVTALLTLPLDVPPGREPGRLHVALARALAGAASRWRRRRRLGVVPLVVGLAISLFGLRHLRWQDDPRSLTATDPALEREDERVRAAAFGPEESRFVVATATTAGPAGVEEALWHNDQLAGALAAARGAGEIQGFSSLHSLLWSRRLQDENQAWIAAHVDEEAIPRALAAEGFVASSFQPFGPGGLGALRGQAPLTPESFPAGLRQAVVDPWFVDLGGKPAVLTRLAGVRDEARLAARLAGLSGVRAVDVASFRVETYARFRQRLLQLLGIGLVIIILVLYARYREPRKTVAALAPAILAAAVSMSVLGLLGVSLNLMHVMGLLLVLSMGADYGIFLVEAEADDSPTAPATLCITMSCATTVLSFGMLGVSRVPALAAVGQMIGLGICLALLFSPAALVLVRRAPPGVAGGRA